MILSKDLEKGAADQREWTRRKKGRAFSLSRGPPKRQKRRKSSARCGRGAKKEGAAVKPRSLVETASREEEKDPVLPGRKEGKIASSRRPCPREDSDDPQGGEGGLITILLQMSVFPLPHAKEGDCRMHRCRQRRKKTKVVVQVLPREKRHELREGKKTLLCSSKSIGKRERKKGKRSVITLCSNSQARNSCQGGGGKNLQKTSTSCDCHRQSGGRKMANIHHIIISQPSPRVSLKREEGGEKNESCLCIRRHLSR